ncbi:hypothetical protein ACN47E_002621 [Coniothyrium glycines]
MANNASAGSAGGDASNLWTPSNRATVESPDLGTPRKTQDQPLNRACEACRISKVRCLMNPDANSTRCQRCAKAGRTCVFAPPAKRRQRKRTDVRVTELEKQIQQMRSLLESSKDPRNGDSEHDTASEQSDEQAESGTPPHVQGNSTTATTTSTIPSWDTTPAVKQTASNLLGSVENDILDRDIISEDLARELMDIWRNELASACPGITIPKDWTVMDVREKKPALFHAIMAAAAHSKGSALSDRLHEETVYLYARSAFIQGEKSVQAIQALLVTVSYYSPSKTPGQLQIYQWVNMASSMALELGLTSKPRTHEQLPRRAIRSLQKISSPEELLEHCRLVLLLYIVGAGFAMRLKRPNILQFNSWMVECAAMLEKSKSLDDKRITAWLKMQRIADEANTAFGFDDASTSFSLSELRMQIILRIFDRRMQDWRKSVPDDVMTIYMNIEYYQNMLSMWEFGMDGGRFDVIEFRNRHITLPALDDDSVQPESLLSRSALQINATTRCVSAAHAILEIWRDIPAEHLRKAPNVTYVRAVYSLVTLMKAEYAVGTDPDMGELLESQYLKVDYYLDKVLQKTNEARGPQKCRNPSHWSFIIEAKLKSWWDEYQEWRREGRHFKRRKTNAEDRHTATTGNQNPVFAQPAMSSTGTSLVGQPQSMAQHAPSLPNFGLATTYPTWNANAVPLDTTATPQPIVDPNAYTPDMSDFSTAFQNGDLYLWNDVSLDLGGWVPPTGPYSGMEFGPMSGSGF